MGMGTIWHWIHWIHKFQVITSHYILNWYVMYTYMCVLILYCYRLLYELYDLTSTSSGPDPSNSLCSAPSYSLIGDSAQPNRSIAPAKLSTSPWPGCQMQLGCSCKATDLCPCHRILIYSVLGYVGSCNCHPLWSSSSCVWVQEKCVIPLSPYGQKE